MRRAGTFGPCALALLAALVGIGAETANEARQGDSQGWQIPATAAAEGNPIAVTPAVLARGRDLYRSKCQKCHGQTGGGNGPEADPDEPPGDLTDPKRAPRNPDGVMFYKIWNGRSDPKMPAFKTEMPREDVWTVIQYVKTLRRGL
jgi:mono/diheme cytochrome c family protein